MRKKTSLLLALLLCGLAMRAIHAGGILTNDDSSEDEEPAEEVMKSIVDEKAFFKLHDLDEDGVLSWDEYKHTLDTIGEDMHGKDYVPNDKTTREDFDKEDTDGDGNIDMEEWLSASFHEDSQNPMYNENELEELTPEEKEELRLAALDEFKEFDKNKNGELTYEELHAVVKEEEEMEARSHPDAPKPEGNLEESVKDMFADLDINMDGIVTLLEFLTVQYQMDGASGLDPHSEGGAAKTG